MRNKFADTIYKLSKKNKKICVLVADISPAGSIQKFRNEFPERFINTGVAEQTMIGISAGLALKGYRPFCYTISTFTLYRPFEFIRVDLCYQKLPVTIIGMGAGTIYSTLGSTHQTIEDISIATSLPNMTVIAPCDPDEMKQTVAWCAKQNKGPVYIRLGKAGEPNLTYRSLDKFSVGKIRYLRKGVKKLALIGYGIIMKKITELEQILISKYKIKPSVICNHTLKPLDVKGLSKILKKYENLAIIEDHVPQGGLNSKIRELANIQKS